MARTLLNRRWVQYDWRPLARHVMPLLIPASENDGLADDGLADVVVDRAAQDVLKLAGVCSSMVTERGVNWFSYEPPFGLEDDADSLDWFSKATKVVQKVLEQSNFYTEQHSAVVDRIVAGTGLMLIEADEERVVSFVHVPAGTYAIAENAQHEVDTVVRVFKFTPHQAVQKFGLGALSEQMRKDYLREDARYTEEYEVWHLVEPRDVADLGNAQQDVNGREVKLNPLQMRWRSVYMEAVSGHVLQESGFYEFPYLCSRYLKLAGNPYGVSALYGLEDTLRKVIELQGAFTDGAMASAQPRVLVTPDLVENVCLEAGGVTVVSVQAGNSGMPKVGESVVKYPVGQALMEEKLQSVDKALFIPDIQVVSNVERPMTATEAQLRANEKVMTFAPTFTQYVADLRRPMERIFAICYRAGLFPKNYVPRGLLSPTEASEGRLYRINAPGAAYIGRMAKALESNKVRGLQTLMEFGAQMAQATGDAGFVEAIRPAHAMKYFARELNVPDECTWELKRLEEMQEKRERQADARAAAEVEQMRAAAAKDAAAAVQDKG